MSTTFLSTLSFLNIFIVIVLTVSVSVLSATRMQENGSSARLDITIPENSFVHVIAPSGRTSETDLPKIRNYITSIDLIPILRSDIYSNSSIEPIYSNTDNYRAMDLIDALTDNSTLVWCIRGGAGASRLIPYLDSQLPSTLPPKLFIGFSDITVLHIYLIKRYGWSTIHGGMLTQIVNSGLDSDSVSLLLDLIFDRRPNLQYNLQCLNSACRSSNSTINSSIIGGNLVLVQASLGTSWEIETENKFVFLEDTGEAPYRTERGLDHLKQAGVFNNAQGVLLGDFIGSGDEALNNFVLQRFANSLTNVPVYKLAGVGHARRNLPLPLNTNAEIRLINEDDEVNRLLIVESPHY